MRNLKKILALSLVFAMVFSLSFSAMAVTRKDFADKGELNPLYNSSVDLLLQLGILQGKPGGNLDPSGVYTRAEMAYLTAAIMLGGNIAAAEPYTNAAYRDANGIATFSDVSDSDWYAGALYYLVHTGIVSGTGNGTYNPAGNATRLEVAAYALGIIGYDKEKQGYLGNAWTLNVQRDAAYCGLYTDISASETNITREQVFKMMDNALMNDSIAYNPVTGQAFYPADGSGNGITVLTLRFKQYTRIEGLFVTNQYVSLTGGATEKGRIQLDDAVVTNEPSVHTAIIDNVNMEQAPVAALGRKVAVFAKKTNVAGRYDGLLGNVIPTDEAVPIGLSNKASDFTSHASKVGTGGSANNTEAIFENMGAANTSVRTNMTVANLGTDSQWSTAGYFQKGDTTEAYAVREYGNQRYTYVFRNTWTLLEISDVASNGKVSAVEFGDANVTVFEDIDPATFENGANVKKGDVVFALLKSDNKPISVQFTENLKANLSSRTGQDVTLSGKTYTVLDTLFAGGKNRGDLLDQIVAAENFGAQRDYFLWTNAVTGAVRVVGYRGPAAPDATYAIVLTSSPGTLSMNAGAELLMDDGTTGVFAVSSLKYVTTPYNFTSDTAPVYNTIDGKKVGPSTRDLFDANPSSPSDNTVLYEYVISDDGSSVALTEVTTAWVYAADNAVALTTPTYKKGNSYINNGSGALYLNNNSLIFAVDANAGAGASYYCFKGRTASNIDHSDGDSGVYALGKDGSVSFAFIKYANPLGIGGNFGVLTSAITVSGTDKNITLSFKMYDLKTGTNQNYTVTNFKDEDGTVLTSGTQPDLQKGDIIEYTTTGEEGVIKAIRAPAWKNHGTPFGSDAKGWTEATDSTVLLEGQTDGTNNGWYTLTVGNVTGFNAYIVTGLDTAGKKLASGTSMLGNSVSDSFKNVIRINGETLFADLRKSDTNPSGANANTLNSQWKNVAISTTTSLSLLTSGPGLSADVKASTDDKAFEIDVKLSYNTTDNVFIAEAIVIRKGLVAVEP